MSDPDPIDESKLVPLLQPIVDFMSRQNLGRMMIEAVVQGDEPLGTAVAERPALGDLDEDPSPFGLDGSFVLFEDSHFDE